MPIQILEKQEWQHPYLGKYLRTIIKEYITESNLKFQEVKKKTHLYMIKQEREFHVIKGLIINKNFALNPSVNVHIWHTNFWQRSYTVITNVRLSVRYVKGKTQFFPAPNQDRGLIFSVHIPLIYEHLIYKYFYVSLRVWLQR